jgi:hypothetical protein
MLGEHMLMNLQAGNNMGRISDILEDLSDQLKTSSSAS